MEAVPPFDPAMVPFISTQFNMRFVIPFSDKSHHCRGRFNYRDVIPLRAAIESADTYAEGSRRVTTSVSDLFLKLVRGRAGGGTIHVCNLKDLRGIHSVPVDG